MLRRPSLSIPQPCQENWQAMTPTAQGRHCAACTKVVIDFTSMSDAEIVAYLGRSAGASCGRFHSSQLNRALTAPLPEPCAAGRKRWLALVAFLGIGTLATPVVQAQLPQPVLTEHPYPVTMGLVATRPTTGPGVPPAPVVRGVVLEAVGRVPLPGVIVTIAETTVGVSTNDDGTFELVLPATFRQSKSVLLYISSVGYESQYLQVNPQDTATQRIVLASGSRMLGEVVLIDGRYATPWYSPRGLWNRITRPFRQKQKLN
ncbi:carboxypeptidase-like regulatory domain-containing protein [Hymenobacter mucosus]|uniref:CarboxypepD_reg-like domain-containing protein n=1 Tax=Hymenobacter mucosus TaxID=1411120 RepID=A0A238YRD5_9BACT|nr:carboxypeptidase-like regulatory domain-containing protein [Hymenobacter mucosus]SNR73705.1 CarboxypepD_reg-like domain-containing protein [Hymenobacter mucosus]